jgi:CHAT domain-containing protein
LEIQERAVGPRHPIVATNLRNLATLHYKQGAYDLAEHLYLRALRIRRESLGPQHPDVAESLEDLGEVYWAQGTHQRSEPFIARAAALREEELQRDLMWLSAPRKRSLLKRLQHETDRMVSLQVAAGSPTWLELGLTTTLRRKGRVLDSLVENHAALFECGEPPVRNALRDLAQVNTEIATRRRCPLGDPDRYVQHQAVDTLIARIDELETRLSRLIGASSMLSAPVTVSDLQAALPASGALLEYVRYRRIEPTGRWRGREERYLVYIVQPNRGPQAVDLGSADEIDQVVAAVLRNMQPAARPDDLHASLRRLDALLFAPIRPHLDNVEHLLISPDSELNMVAFEALVDPAGHYAVEQWLVSYVSAGRDLVRSTRSRRPRSPFTIFADPDDGPSSTPAPNGVGRSHPFPVRRPKPTPCRSTCSGRAS